MSITVVLFAEARSTACVLHRPADGEITHKSVYIRI